MKENILIVDDEPDILEFLRLKEPMIFFMEQVQVLFLKKVIEKHYLEFFLALNFSHKQAQILALPSNLGFYVSHQHRVFTMLFPLIIISNQIINEKKII